MIPLEALEAMNASVEFEYRAGPSALMEAVDVLRQDHHTWDQALKPDEGVVAIVRLSSRDQATPIVVPAPDTGGVISKPVAGGQLLWVVPGPQAFMGIPERWDPVLP